MNAVNHRWISVTVLFLAVILVISGCQSVPKVQPTTTSQPTLSLTDTYANEMAIFDFSRIHQPVSGDSNKFLIFGNVPVFNAAELPPELAVNLGRWEGFVNFMPDEHGRKVVLAISKISATSGRLYAYSGYDLQFPDISSQVAFRVVSGNPPTLQFQAAWLDDNPRVYTFTYDQARGKLVGWVQDSPNGSKSGPYELTRDSNFYVYKDYPAYLASLRIYGKEYQDRELNQYSAGYLLYLPEGYEADAQKTWPMIYFLHGMGEIGEDVDVLARPSPFMFILDHGPLPAIMVAPQAKNSQPEKAFPEAFLDGVLKEVQAIYRIDPKRIYLTGLSLGGEATWRFALYRPDTFAAISPLSAFLFEDADPAHMKPIQSMPVWAIHGADDDVIPLAKGQQVVDALKAAGGNVKFTVLQDHGHDTWTDTYSDPAFYNWLFQHARQ